MPASLAGMITCHYIVPHGPYVAIVGLLDEGEGSRKLPATKMRTASKTKKSA